MKFRLLFTVLFFAALGPWGASSALLAQPVAPAVSGNGRPDLVTRLDVPATPANPVPASSLVAELEKMMAGGADADVIKAYVSSWNQPFSISADEILRLHDLGAPSEILTALIRRSGELQASRAVAATTNQPAPPSYPAMASPTNAPALVYPYPASSGYNYSYLSPSYPLLPGYSYAYSYGAWPYSYRYYWGSPYRYYGWNRPWYGYRYPAYSYGYHYPGYWRGGNHFYHGPGRGYISGSHGGYYGGGMRGGGRGHR